MAELLPVARTENVIVTAYTLPSLCETGTFSLHNEDKGLQDKPLPRDSERPVKAAFLLERGILSAIRPEARSADLPPGWRRLFLPSDRLLVPAFVDCHIHIALDGVGGFRNLTAPPPPDLLLSRLRAVAAAGVLAARDGGDCHSSAITAQRLRTEAVKAAQEAGPLPQIVPTGLSIYRHGYYGAKLGGEGLHGLETLKMELRRRKDAGAQQLKVILSGLVSLRQPGKVGPLQFSLDEMQQIVQCAADMEMPVMVHASSDAAVRLAVQAGAHSVEHGYFVKEETLKAMAAKGVAWIPTIAPMAFLAQWGKEPGSADSETMDTGADAAADGNDNPGGPAADPQNRSMLRSIVEEHLRMIARAHAWGVTIGVGTDGGAPGVSWSGGFWLELALLSQAAFTPAALLSLATINGAAVLGLAQKWGRIAVGKPPYWLSLDMDFLQGRIEQQTLKDIIYLKEFIYR